MDVFARSTGEVTEIYTVESSTAAIAVLGAALGAISALIAVAVMWFIGIGVNGAFVGAIAGGIAGVATALLGAPGRIE
ncbi:MAG: hypothetical protein WBV06_16760 [Acidimicrobiia bacterium]